MKDSNNLQVSFKFVLGLIFFFVFLPIAVLLIVVNKLSQSSDLDEEYSKVKDKVKKVEKKVEAKLEPILKDLSDRQGQILSEIVRRGEVEMSHLTTKFKGVTPRTLRRDLEKLASMGHVAKSGSTRNSVYTPKKS